jgi:TolA-binding protein
MRSIFAGMIVLSAAIGVVHTTDAQEYSQRQPSYESMQAPIDLRQQTADDVEKIKKDNEQLDLSASREKITGADQVQSEENALARTIERENERIDRQLRGICRGC